ncbi:hypothetical protein [Mesonia mobilis]|uniref:Uncharacterized protein n=1 Tax=Mesonia mobilis TaxID=369791 RepID=A0ABQ3C8L4_9FLAO|nr:hypothetical protein [Mesonia mobilis]MBQ0739629.1 hypothetical protein [Aquimarina celericrescens]GGZ65670.1 hypothetical protein GCM10008088_28610 [Mesonia mobilis]
MNFNSFFLNANNKIFNIQEIKWWLLKYTDIYNQIITLKKNKYVTVSLNDGKILKLPPLNESTEYIEFLDLYKRLENISELHKYENYFEEQINEYCNIKKSNYELKKWVAKSEDLGTNNFVLFLIDYLDYSANPKHLNVYLPYSKELDLYIDRKDFKNTIEFLEIFNELYWIQEILPKNQK